VPLSKSGRVVIVDDQYDQAIPLMEALGSKGAPYLYFNGKVKTLPKKPVEGVRFVFLDIELDGMAGQDDKSKASGLVAVLKKIIGESNGPYVIIFWTTHHNVRDLVLENCATKKISPVISIDLDKADCMVGDSIAKITSALDLKLKDIGAFQLYTEWENLIHTSASEVVEGLSNIAKEKTGKEWSKKTAALFFTLYKNYVDKNVTENNEEKFRLSCHLLNRTFSGVLESNTALKLKLPDGLKINQAIALSDMEKARLNKALFIGDSLSSKPSTGDVYFEDGNAKLLNDMKKAIFSDAPGSCRLCKVVLTPECDIAQNKTFKTKYRTKEISVHRVLYGLLYEEKKQPRGQVYKVGPIAYRGNGGGDERSILIHFLFSTLTTCRETDFKGAPVFTLKRDLCFDLQSKAANNLNRLGEYQFS